MKPGRTHVTAYIKGELEESSALVVAHVQQPHREPRPIANSAERKRDNASNPERWTRQAMRLIRLGATGWTQRELDQSATLQDSVRGWLDDKRRQDWRRYRTLFRDLGKVHQLAKQRLELESRGTGGQHDHPERNNITEFGPASGRITWATERKRR